MSFWDKGTELANVSNGIFKFLNVSLKGTKIQAWIFLQIPLNSY
jgi:hypothetical protein